MRTIPWLTAAVVGLLIAGCAGIASAPSQEERQVLAPTGKLRVALYLGVPFEPVVYPSPGAIMDGLKAGEWDLTFFGPSPGPESVLNFTAPFLVIEHGYLVPAGEEMLKSGKAEVFAANKANLFELSGKLPGSRVLDGRIGVDEVAIALPKGRESGMAYLRKSIEDAKSEGLIKAAFQRAGLRGAADK